MGKVHHVRSTKALVLFMNASGTDGITGTIPVWFPDLPAVAHLELLVTTNAPGLT